MGRDYGQYCGLARALEVVGDRWNLLIVRELLIKPARYGELREGLSSIATNLLTVRLRDLEAAGVIERRLSDDSNAIIYALTPWGAQLREPINGLIRWSTPLMICGPQGDEFRADGLFVALPALFAGRVPAQPGVSVAVVVDAVMVQLHATASGVEVSEPDGRDLAAVLTAEGALILGLSAGALALDDVRAIVDIDGDESALRNFFEAPHSAAEFTGVNSTVAHPPPVEES